MKEENSLVEFVFQQCNRMSCIIRYNNTPKLTPESVAEHSYYVAFLAMLLGDYFSDRGMVINKEKLMKMALLHDVEEIISGDIIKILKAGDFKEALDKLNRRSMQYLCDVLSGRKAAEYYKVWEETKAKVSIEARIIDLVDMLSCMIYCLKEVHCGNRYFKEILIFASRWVRQCEDLILNSGEIINAFVSYVKSYLADDQKIIDGIDSAVRINHGKTKRD